MTADRSLALVHVPEELTRIDNPVKLIEAFREFVPPKIFVPLNDLHDRHLLATNILVCLLKSWILSGRNPHLLAFAIAWHSLDTHPRTGMSMADIVDMAWQHRRRINLSWSPNRWNQVHNQLARIATFTRLGENPVAYTGLERYARYLPDNFPGYLIDNSRRLAAEGLRQDHCIASYHDRILKGDCAILTVLLGGRRYTVSLAPKPQTPRTFYPVAPNSPPVDRPADPVDSADPTDRGLQIEEIRGRHNLQPDHATFLRIRNALSIEPCRELLNRYTPDCSDNTTRMKVTDTARATASALCDAGVHHALVSWCGSGDEGCIHSIDLRDEQDRPILDDARISIPVVLNRYDAKREKWTQTTEIEDTLVERAVENLIDEYISAHCPGIEYNDGGEAEFVIRPGSPDGATPPTFSMRILENIVEQETVHDTGPQPIHTGAPH